MSPRQMRGDGLDIASAPTSPRQLSGVCSAGSAPSGFCFGTVAALSEDGRVVVRGAAAATGDRETEKGGQRGQGQQGAHGLRWYAATVAFGSPG